MNSKFIVVIIFFSTFNVFVIHKESCINASRFLAFVVSFKSNDGFSRKAGRER